MNGFLAHPRLAMAFPQGSCVFCGDRVRVMNRPTPDPDLLYVHYEHKDRSAHWCDTARERLPKG